MFDVLVHVMYYIHVGTSWVSFRKLSKGGGGLEESGF